MDYRSLPRYANSDLTEFRNLIFNRNAKPCPSAQEFGTAFHQWMLEDVEPHDLTTARQKQAAAMRSALLDNAFARFILKEGQTEKVQLWDDQGTGLPCKARLDIWLPQDGLIVDIKTTSAKSYREFLAACYLYDYDRQGAYYLDGTPHASHYVILGVQKQAPWSVFYFEATSCKGCIDGGRKKYTALFREIQKRRFQPSSWPLEPFPINSLTRQAS